MRELPEEPIDVWTVTDARTLLGRVLTRTDRMGPGRYALFIPGRGKTMPLYPNGNLRQGQRGIQMVRATSMIWFLSSRIHRPLEGHIYIAADDFDFCEHSTFMLLEMDHCLRSLLEKGFIEDATAPVSTRIG